MRRLVVIGGRATPPAVELEGEVVIGRATDSGLQVFDETASRRHARVATEDGRLVVEDLGSANGVYLNGERVRARAVLVHGDEIRIGGVTLQYRADDATERRTVARPPTEDEAGVVETSVDAASADPSADADTEAARRRVRLLCDGATAAADAADEAEALLDLVELATRAFTPDRATVTLAFAGGREQVAAAWPEGARPSPSRTIRRRVLEEGEAVLVRDAHGPSAGEAASIVASRHRSTLAAPLATAEGALGFVALEAEAPDRWGPEDLRVLAAAARQTALAVRNLRTLDRARSEARRLAVDERGGTATLLGASPAMEDVRRQTAKAAAVDSSVLVTGETGTGKELVARCLHEAGPRQDEPFVAVNCAAFVEGLIESELFGHEKGAFTGATERHAGRIEQAGRGTLFLDEVGELSGGLQAKLLRVLSEGTYTRVGGQERLRLGCRVVAATNRDLARMVEDDAFRRDLYFRLAVLEIRLPPLRERAGDVPLLAEAGLERIAARLGRPVPRLSADAREALEAHAWPGNVRELQNALERALVLLEGDTLTAADLPPVLGEGRAPAAGRAAAPGETLSLKEAEARAVRAALAAAKGRKGRAAELLGTSWPTLNRKLRQHGIDVRDYG